MLASNILFILLIVVISLIFLFGFLLSGVELYFYFKERKIELDKLKECSKE